MNKYNISVLSPIHIGNGNKLSTIDFVYDNNTLWIIDIEKVILDVQVFG
ncbi:MAG: hypothetical protein AB1422_06890 [bacterium]